MPETRTERKRTFLDRDGAPLREVTEEEKFRIIEPHIALRRAKMLAEDFEHAEIVDGDLSDGEFRNCNFNRAVLNGVNFAESDLRGSSFRRAELSGANFRGANLTETDLYCAELNDALLDTSTIINWFSHDLLGVLLMQHVTNYAEESYCCWLKDQKLRCYGRIKAPQEYRIKEETIDRFNRFSFDIFMMYLKSGDVVTQTMVNEMEKLEYVLPQGLVVVDDVGEESR